MPETPRDGVREQYGEMFFPKGIHLKLSVSSAMYTEMLIGFNLSLDTSESTDKAWKWFGQRFFSS